VYPVRTKEDYKMIKFRLSLASILRIILIECLIFKRTFHALQEMKQNIAQEQVKKKNLHLLLYFNQWNSLKQSVIILFLRNQITIEKKRKNIQKWKKI
jgi:hypothetical protein